MNAPEHEASSLPWFRDELRRHMAGLEQEIAAHRHTLDLLRQTENAYGRFVPHQLLQLLNVQSILDLELGEQTERKMTILFTDIRDFSRMSESMSPQETFAFINSFLGEMEPLISRHGGIVDKYMGDAIMALFPSDADDAVRCSIAMLAQLELYNQGRTRAGYPSIRIGIGLNTGVVMLGTVGGTQRMQGTVLSDAVNLASRLEGTTKVYGTPLLISEFTLYALKDPSQFRIRFLDRIRVKGKTQPQAVYEVFDNDSPAMRAGKEATRTRFEEALAYYHLKMVDRALPLLESCLREDPGDEPARIYLERCRKFLDTGVHEGTGENWNTLPWRDEFLVGVEQIDTEHRELLARINRLAARIGDGDPSGIDETLDFLDDYVRLHFGNEEAVMLAVDYPLRADHIHEHRTFVERFLLLKADIAAGTHDPIYLGFRIQLFLFDWFANHITKIDRHLGKFIRARGGA